MERTESYAAVVIGGGPAGLFCALRAAGARAPRPAPGKEARARPQASAGRLRPMQPDPGRRHRSFLHPLRGQRRVPQAGSAQLRQPRPGRLLRGARRGYGRRARRKDLPAFAEGVRRSRRSHRRLRRRQGQSPQRRAGHGDFPCRRNFYHPDELYDPASGAGGHRHRRPHLPRHGLHGRRLCAGPELGSPYHRARPGFGRRTNL